MHKVLIGESGLRYAVLLLMVLSGLVVTVDGAPHAPRSTKWIPGEADALLSFLSPSALNPSEALRPRDADLYRQIFAAQSAGRFAEANNLLSRVSNPGIRGDVLAQQYLDPANHPTYADLTAWLTQYPDLPGADRIYRLAVARRPADAAVPPRPKPVATGITGYLDMFTDGSDAYVSQRTRTPAQEAALDTLSRTIRDDADHGEASRAATMLTKDPSAKLLDAVETDQLRAAIASSFYYQGHFVSARQMAEAAAKRSGDRAPLAGWIGGLTEWRRGDYHSAANLFELSAKSPYASSWTAAAGAYWASRAHGRMGDALGAMRWERTAATYPRTFYGLLALRKLKQPITFHWDVPNFTPSLRAKLASVPAGRRAMALVDAGQLPLAQAELAQINPGTDHTMTLALLAYANEAKLPGLAMRLAEAVPHPGGGLYDAALYPLSPWAPSNGYTVDRALIHAIVRQESRFDPDAQSQSGAFGLMQLMPNTASDVTGGREAPALRDPAINLDLGQRYVATLLSQDPVDTDLVAMTTAYNAGPGNLKRWQEAYDQGGGRADPLLFIESLPVAQTRAFVERVLTNYWIYQLRLNQSTTSLDAMANGKSASYLGMDENNDLALAATDLTAADLDPAGGP